MDAAITAPDRSTDPTGGGAGGNNMVLVEERAYDGGLSGGDGNLTQLTRYVDAFTSRVTTATYDWRDRRVSIDGEEDFFQALTYDNLNRVTCAERFDTTAAGNLVARADTLYDDLGRVYQAIAYGVDPDSGTVTGSLTANTWYGAAGNVIKRQPAGTRTSTKTAYDGAGRTVATYTSYDLDAASYVDAASIASDTVLEQVETDYDAADNVILVTTRRRLPTADSTLGTLGDAAAEPLARVSYQASWYDGAGRQASTADYGTNDGEVVVRPAEAPAPSDTVLVSTTDYNDRGEAFQATDPAGKIAYHAFDDAARLVTQIQNYVDGAADPALPDEDVTISTTYTPDGRVATLTAVNPTTGDQVTQYVYGASLDSSGLARNDLLVAEIYPDSTDAADCVSYTYDRLGEVVTKTDQNGSVHSYTYDGLGRQIFDSITTLGSGVDGAVQCIGRTYEVRGNVASLSSYEFPTGGGIVNQVTVEYNAFAQVITEYQDHWGTVDTSRTPRVQYGYADGSAGHGHIRPTRLVYPNGRVLRYEYNAGADDAANRVSFLADDNAGSVGTHLAEYQYLGLDTILGVSYPQPQIAGTFDVDPSAPGTYPGLDRFDRVVDLLWQDTATGAAIERIQHGYDRAGNRLWRQCPVATAAGQNFDELYSYLCPCQLAGADFLRGDRAACWALAA